MNTWHERALQYDAQGLTKADITRKIEAEFGLSDMYNTVKSYIRRQRKDVIKNYPRRKGITTHFITGNHDASLYGVLCSGLRYT